MNHGLRAEGYVKKKLERQHNTTLEKKKLKIGKKSNGKPILHEFDLVSSDGKLVIEVKSYKLGNETTKKAGYSTTRKSRLISACFYLSKVKKATTRFLVLTNKELHSQFIKDMDGLLDAKIEIICLPFDPERIKRG